MKTYDFEITIILDSIDIEAKNEKEARSQLTEQVRDYFAETTIEIGEKEAKLCTVKDFENNTIN